MKFLAFNILVGAALTWLFLGGDNAQALLTAAMPGSKSSVPAVAQCPTPASKIVAETNQKIDDATRPGAATAPVVPATIQVSEQDETRSEPPTRLAAVSPGADPHSGVEIGANDTTRLPVDGTLMRPSRRDTLRSLAESMELFSLERVGK